MSSVFDRWEKDPFFSAAEEVQESTDRMESVYRRWMYERRNRSEQARSEDDVAAELRRELRTALGTAKWQLEEFDRASRMSDERFLSKDDARIRHTQFISAIGNQILTVENSLRESELEGGEGDLSWVRLDEGERDELAVFLSGPSAPEGETVSVSPDQGSGRLQWRDMKQADCGAALDCCEKTRVPLDALSSWEGRVGKVHVHRRTASAGSDIEAWAITVNEHSSHTSSDDRPHSSLPKVLSLSGLGGAMESTTKLKWMNNFRKWKRLDHHDASESIPLQNHQELDSCYERSKSYVSSCSDNLYNKQLYGWLGTVQRQLQRSQYQIQYARPIQLIFWIAAALLLIVFFALCAI